MDELHHVILEVDEDLHENKTKEEGDELAKLNSKPGDIEKQNPHESLDIQVFGENNNVPKDKELLDDVIAIVNSDKKSRNPSDQLHENGKNDSGVHRDNTGDIPPVNINHEKVDKEFEFAPDILADMQLVKEQRKKDHKRKADREELKGDLKKFIDHMKPPNDSKGHRGDNIVGGRETKVNHRDTKKLGE